MKTQYIAAWKSGVAVSWRGLTWSEYRKFTRRLAQGEESPLEVHMDLYRTLLLEGPDLEEAPSGVVEFVARSMLNTNPFGGEYDDIVHALNVRRNAQDYLEEAKALVAGIFRYTFEEIDTWDADTFFDRVAKAEFLAGKRIEPVDPKAPPPPGQPGAPGQRRPKKPMTENQKLAFERSKTAYSK